MLELLRFHVYKPPAKVYEQWPQLNSLVSIKFESRYLDNLILESV